MKMTPEQRNEKRKDQQEERALVSRLMATHYGGGESERAEVAPKMDKEERLLIHQLLMRHRERMEHHHQP